MGVKYKGGPVGGAVALRGNSGDILEKSHRATNAAHHKQQGYYTRLLRRTNMAWHVEEGVLITHSSPDLPVAHLNAIGQAQQ